MMITAQRDFDQAVKQYNLAMSYFFEGNPEPINNFYSKSDKVSLAQLSGGLVLGRKPVTDTVTHNAMKYQEGETTFETLMKYVTPEFAYVIQVERTIAKIDGSKEVTSLALRVTSIFLHEGGVWKLLHRHVDSNVFPPA